MLLHKSDTFGVVDDISAETFRRALRRFAPRRGIPCLIVDAKTFKLAAKTLNKLKNHPETRNEFDKLHIQWKFNLERAPWWRMFFDIILRRRAT